MAYSFLFGDVEGKQRGEREKKTVLIALRRVCRPNSAVIFKSLHPPIIQPLSFFFHDDFTSDFFLSPIAFLFHPRVAPSSIWSRKKKPSAHAPDLPSGPVGVKENYRPIRQSLYKYSFFFFLLLLFLFLSLILPFFFLSSIYFVMEEKKIDNCSSSSTRTSV